MIVATTIPLGRLVYHLIESTDRPAQNTTMRSLYALQRNRYCYRLPTTTRLRLGGKTRRVNENFEGSLLYRHNDYVIIRRDETKGEGHT